MTNNLIDLCMMSLPWLLLVMACAVVYHVAVTYFPDTADRLMSIIFPEYAHWCSWDDEGEPEWFEVAR